ncbi:unnamed protein product [Parnassius mnemosyne]|uniref:Uncharacterized protein n=1 Tax=Parnassius mnemosyne TaxID=213953 RepID=A0AAV1LCN5_9NEOP
MISRSPPQSTSQPQNIVATSATDTYVSTAAINFTSQTLPFRPKYLFRFRWPAEQLTVPKGSVRMNSIHLKLMLIECLRNLFENNNNNNTHARPHTFFIYF